MLRHLPRTSGEAGQITWGGCGGGSPCCAGRGHIGESSVMQPFPWGSEVGVCLCLKWEELLHQHLPLEAAFSFWTRSGNHDDLLLVALGSCALCKRVTDGNRRERGKDPTDGSGHNMLACSSHAASQKTLEALRAQQLFKYPELPPRLLAPTDRKQEGTTREKVGLNKNLGVTFFLI